jgi:Flp pilus assembly secretin CpaC
MPIRLSSLSLAVALLVAAGAAAQSPPEQAEGRQVQMDVQLVRLDRTWLRAATDRGWNLLDSSPTLGSPGQGKVFAGTLISRSGFQRLLLKAEETGHAKVLAQPRLLTLSGQQTSFLAGGEQVAVPVGAGSGQVRYQFEEFGTRLNLLPVIRENGKIRLEVEPEISEFDPNAAPSSAGTPVLARSTQRLHTTAELKSGQTFVLGGLVSKPANLEEKEGELLILVTPHLVPSAAEQQRKTAEAAKLWDAYLRACDEGRPEAARALAQRMLELDPTCFRERAR